MVVGGGGSCIVIPELDVVLRDQVTAVILFWEGALLVTVALIIDWNCIHS